MNTIITILILVITALIGVVHEKIAKVLIIQEEECDATESDIY